MFDFDGQLIKELMYEVFDVVFGQSVHTHQFVACQRLWH